jgi:predicted SnoaL-like aldol condensation-catalyzing enzyme
MEDRERVARAAVQSVYRDVLQQRRLEQLPALFAPGYVPHAPEFVQVTGLVPGVAALTARLQRAGTIPNEVQRLICDGELVLAHVFFPGEIPVAGADIFRFDATGRICDHWNVRQPLLKNAARAREHFTGPTVAAEAGWDRERLKHRLRTMLEDLWSRGNAELVPEYYAESYIQHNPDMPGGYARIREIVQTDIRRYIDASGGPFPVTVHRVGAEGDFVFVHLSLFMAGINRNAGDRSTNVDIFRVDASGRMVEHWDVLQMASEGLPDDRLLF